MQQTFKQFLMEAPKSASLQELLNGPCKNFLQQSQKNGFLFRGVQTYGEAMGHLTIGKPAWDDLGRSYYKKKVRKDRKPMNTKGVVHKIIDDWFEEEMGIRARSQAVFCTGERGRETAATYGNRSIILPIGKFNYTWSPHVADLYDVIREKFEDPESSSGRLRRRWLGSDGKPDLEIISDAMKDLKYTMNHFDKACASYCEIMIECDEYYVIPYDDDDQLYDLKKAFAAA